MSQDKNPNWDISTVEGLKNAIEWQTNHVARISEGGFWMVPRSWSAYRLSHKAKIAVKMCGADEPDITKVFRAMGWTVVDHIPSDEQP